MRKFAAFVLSLSLIFGGAFALTGCAENADIIQETTMPDYHEVMDEIETVHLGYSEFMNAGEGEIYYKNSDGFTPDENPCYATFVESVDGMYKVCTLTSSRDNVESVYDEYTYINDTTLFIVRSFITEDNEITIDKYVVIDNILYSIDETEETLTVVDRPDSLGFYLSFDELKSLYGDFSE